MGRQETVTKRRVIETAEEMLALCNELTREVETLKAAHNGVLAQFTEELSGLVTQLAAIRGQRAADFSFLNHEMIRVERNERITARRLFAFAGMTFGRRLRWAFTGRWLSFKEDFERSQEESEKAVVAHEEPRRDHPRTRDVEVPRPYYDSEIHGPVYQHDPQLTGLMQPPTL